MTSVWVVTRASIPQAASIARRGGARRRTTGVAAAFAVLSLVLVACGGDDDSADSGDSTTDEMSESSDEAATSTTPQVTTATTTTVAATTTTTVALVTEGASVMVANASGINGAAGRMSVALEEVGFTVVAAANSTESQLSISKIYYDPANPDAEAVADSVQAVLGGGDIPVEEIVEPPPVDTGTLGDATVLVAMGNDTADKTLAELSGGSAPTAAAPSDDTATADEASTAESSDSSASSEASDSSEASADG